MQKISITFCLSALTFFFLNISHNSAQSIQRQTIGSTGNSSFSDHLLIRQTIGQPYNTTAYYSSEASLRPGFQQPVLSVRLLNSNFNLTVFPNPSINYVIIQSPVVIDNATLKVFDNIGKLLFVQHFEHFQNYQLNCEAYSNGMYALNLSTPDNKSYSAKLIINH